MEVRLITYNIDGLPDKLDLNDLPWPLKPIAWVYKLFKKTTEIPINDGSDRQQYTRYISKALSSYEADVIGVQEDFNYHTELMSCLTNYNDSIRTGSITLKDLFSNIYSIFPLRLKADGLNLLTKKDRIQVNEEDIVPWYKSYGYLTHANDKLTKKGFRYYSITVDGTTNIDVYLVHMDADFYDPINCPDVSKDVEARKNQIQQLLAYIEERNSNNPIIILGDTNSVDKYEWDVTNINILKDAGFNEVTADTQDVDRLFYRGDIKIINAFYGEECLSDHKPFIVDIEL